MVALIEGKRVYVSGDLTHAVFLKDGINKEFYIGDEYKERPTDSLKPLYELYKKEPTYGVISAKELRKFIRLVREISDGAIIKLSVNGNGVVLEAEDTWSNKYCSYSSGGKPSDKYVHVTLYALRTIAEKIFKKAKNLQFAIIEKNEPFAVFEHLHDECVVVFAPLYRE